MTARNDTTIYNIINSLGYLITPVVMLNALVGWLPILICFNSYDYSIGWGSGAIGRWAFLELIFFSLLTVMAVAIGATRLSLSGLPGGWQFLWLLSVWPTPALNAVFGRDASADYVHTNEEAHAMGDDKKDHPALSTQPDRFSAVRPITTVSDKKVTLSNLVPTLVESKMERVRETFEKQEVERQIATLKKKTEANLAQGEYRVSEVDAHYAGLQADERNKLQLGRNARELAEIERDIESIRKPPKDSPASPIRKTDFDDFAEELLNSGATGPHQRKAEAKIAEFIRKKGGEDRLSEEDWERIRRLRAEAAKRDENLG